MCLLFWPRGRVDGGGLRQSPAPRKDRARRDKAHQHAGAALRGSRGRAAAPAKKSAEGAQRAAKRLFFVGPCAVPGSAAVGPKKHSAASAQGWPLAPRSNTATRPKQVFKDTSNMVATKTLPDGSGTAPVRTIKRFEKPWSPRTSSRTRFKGAGGHPVKYDEGVPHSRPARTPEPEPSDRRTPCSESVGFNTPDAVQSVFKSAGSPTRSKAQRRTVGLQSAPSSRLWTTLTASRLVGGSQPIRGYGARGLYCRPACCVSILLLPSTVCVYRRYTLKQVPSGARTGL